MRGQGTFTNIICTYLDIFALLQALFVGDNFDRLLRRRLFAAPLWAPCDDDSDAYFTDFRFDERDERLSNTATSMSSATNGCTSLGPDRQMRMDRICT